MIDRHLLLQSQFLDSIQHYDTLHPRPRYRRKRQVSQRQTDLPGALKPVLGRCLFRLTIDPPNVFGPIFGRCFMCGVRDTPLVRNAA